MKSEVTGQGEPIVLVPGGLTGWLSWIPHAEQLADRYKVIRAQLHSVDYGLRNKRLPKNYSQRYEVDGLKLLFEEQGIESAHLAGWSYGAATSLSFAIHNPEKVKSLTLIEPPAMWVLGEHVDDFPDLQRLDKEMQQFGPDDVTAEQLVMFTHLAGFIPENVDPKTLPQWPLWYKHRRSLLARDKPFRHQDNLKYAAQFDKPVLLVQGDDSMSYYHQIIDILAHTMPHATVLALPGTHNPHIASMDEFMKIFRQFLADAS